MFKRIEKGPNDEMCSFTWDGQPMSGLKGDTIAAALLGAGVSNTREHQVTNEPRAPFCMMGTCFECLVEVDGVPNVQACQVQLAEGMTIRPQRGART